MRVQCLAQELNTVSPARAQTRTARSGDERTNHETTAPPYTNDIELSKTSKTAFCREEVLLFEI